MSTHRLGDWSNTATGRQFWSYTPRSEDVCIDDIALALAKSCRFAGHVRRDVWLYSIAQHSVLVSEVVPLECARHALLHDAHEAYTQDIIRPNRWMLDVRFTDAEYRCKRAIGQRFGVNLLDLPEAVKRADMAVLATERRDVVEHKDRPWQLTEAPLPAPIVPWDARTAYALFLARFRELFPEYEVSL